MKVFKLNFDGPIHISNMREDYAQSDMVIHSDTLTAAIMHTWAMLGMEAKITTPDYGFVVSSLFPFTKSKENEDVFFLPKPFLKVNVKDTNVDFSKELKKVQFVDWDFFQQICANQELDFEKSDFKGKYLTRKPISSDFVWSTLRSRNRIQRNELDDTEPFYMEQIFFKKGSGLWGLASFNSINNEVDFKIAMDELGQNGVGTDRNVGNGQFTPEILDNKQFDIPSSTSEYAVALSLFLPETPEQLAELFSDAKTRYELVKRGGWISEPHNKLRKKSIMMFKEGSIFKTSAKQLGAVVDLKPDSRADIQHPVFRSGKSLFYPIVIHE